ncbi:hypothetical protein GXM_06992 [Nostoc sphaeroides CCNUC1]|uniref:Uncharacterized protein n=1 Tax=Nostoc sphaeroides CCNUC1 TaxID=2653204 RepID=A0A5P8W9S1_9NOSO|nr:hypothetical protein GXM_06992 [Nostoc sphaeroides CCNUC1]
MQSYVACFLSIFSDALDQAANFRLQFQLRFLGNVHTVVQQNFS